MSAPGTLTPEAQATTLEHAPPGVVAIIRGTLPAGHISLPDATCNLIWVRERLIFLGPMTHAVAATLIGEKIQILAIESWAARAWLGVPIEELTDRRIPLADINPRLAGPVAEIFHYGRAATLLRPHPFHDIGDRRVSAAATALRSGAPIADVAERTGLSGRQLERLFADHIGLSPRTFAQVWRFRRALKRIKGEGMSLAEAALASGYADQAHFTRTVRAFTGRTPTALLRHVGNFQDEILGDW